MTLNYVMNQRLFRRGPGFAVNGMEVMVSLEQLLQGGFDGQFQPA